MKLDGFCDFKYMVIDVITEWNYLVFLGNGKEFLGEIFYMFRKT